MRLFYELHRIDDTRIALKLNSRFRYVFAGFLAIILGGTAAAGGFSGEGSIAVPLLLSLLLLGIILYEESWYFDRQGDAVVHHHGLLVAKRRQQYPLSMVNRLEMSSFRKGSTHDGEKRRFFQKDFIRLALIFEKEDRKDIQLTDAKYRQELDRKAVRIAEFTGLEYRRE